MRRFVIVVEIKPVNLRRYIESLVTKHFGYFEIMIKEENNLVTR